MQHVYCCNTHTQYCLLVGIVLIQEASVEAGDEQLLQEVAGRPWADWGLATKLSSVVKRALKLCINKQRLLNGEKPVHQVSPPAKLMTNVFYCCNHVSCCNYKGVYATAFERVHCDDHVCDQACCLAVMQCSDALVPANYLTHTPATYSCSSSFCIATFSRNFLLLVAFEPIHSKSLCKTMCC